MVYFRMASTFSPQELSLFRSIIEEIVYSDDGLIQETEAISLATSMEPRMKVSDSEELIQHLIQDKWLLQHGGKERQLSLSAVTASELSLYLEEVYEDCISKCFLCKIITFKGHRCTKCKVRVHRKCCRKFWMHQNTTSVTCPDPVCGEHWPHVELDLPQKR
ncbi:non-structural maintenance of chromosomes element 1 homolog [Homarus americanus]|uniref:non-structural maintenance of chromosomes element 1 homolog n=1 Tax=Homarus americanus TaxID=6706 RepID=UPI001C47D2D8|nr:non-structural maintenance of chromosomes element 1 homolog [Homarus americanus]